MNTISFPINTKESITIEINAPLKNITSCYFTPIYLLKENKKYYITEDDLLENLRIFKQKLQLAIENKLSIHDSIQDNQIGLLHTQYQFHMINEIDSDNTFIEIDNEWIGEKYFVWGDGFGRDFTLWLYNNKNKEVILEITPTFIDDYFLKDETPNIIAYENFIKNYKSLTKIVIPKNIAQQWLNQVEKIILSVENNIKNTL